MTETLSLLHAPIGMPGSGRVRYGAAMELWREGLITPDVLEVYRIAAAHDGRDPLSVLAALGLPPPPPSPSETPMRQLYQAARGYLLRLEHPGAEEVRAGLPADPGDERETIAAGNPVAQRWLVPALETLATIEPTLAAAISRAAEHLCWLTYDAYPCQEIGEGFATSHAFAILRGGNAPFNARDFELGLLLMAPATLYRDHRHATPELYAPLTGPHGWRFGIGRSVVVKAAHQPVWNPPLQPHLTKVGNVPFLGLYVRTRDVNETGRVIPANDWPKLETLRIG